MSSATVDLRAVLAAWPADCQPGDIELLGGAGGFSGARFWRLDTPRGRLCLRCWPPEHPTPERLEYIQAVLWHVHQEGFKLVPVPLETGRHAGYVCHAGHLWELAPWMPGAADFRNSPSTVRLRAAMTALAEFHRAAESFPPADGNPQPSPGIEERRRKLQALLAGGFAELQAAVSRGPEQDFHAALRGRAIRICQSFLRHAEGVLTQLAAATKVHVPLQPCIRDIWHDHVLFTGDRVSGIVDFGGLRPENVSADAARLLGSLVGDDPAARQAGLSAYEAVRPLAPAERALLAAFDRSSVLLSGLNWLSWLYLEGRRFDNVEGILARLDENIGRLEQMAQP